MPTRTASPNCALGSTAPPAGNCSTRSSSSRNSTSLLRRQSTLESRATALGGVTDPATTGSFDPTQRPGATAPATLDVRAACARPPLVARARSGAGQPQDRQGRRHQRPSWRASKRRSIASIGARPRRSRKCRSATKAKRAKCAACSPISDFKLDVRRRRQRRAVRTGRIARAKATASSARVARVNIARAQAEQLSRNTGLRCRSASR